MILRLGLGISVENGFARVVAKTAFRDVVSSLHKDETG